MCLNQVIFCRLQVWRRPEVPVSEAPEPAQEEVTIAGEEEQEQVWQEVSEWGIPSYCTVF